jgi:hypothetical protein
MSDLHGVIDAFIDDEPVDVAELRLALADASGREYLTDALALRGLVGIDQLGAAGQGRSNRRRSSFSGRAWLAVAALLTVVASLVGYTAGARTTSGPFVTPAPSVEAPAPTKVIRLQSGVDWTERVGGN